MAEGPIKFDDFFDPSDKTAVEAILKGITDVRNGYAGLIKDITKDSSAFKKANLEIVATIEEAKEALKGASATREADIKIIEKNNSIIKSEAAAYKENIAQINKLSVEKNLLIEKNRKLTQEFEKLKKATEATTNTTLTLKQRISEAKKEVDRYADSLDSPEFTKARDTLAKLQAQQNEVTNATKFAIREASVQKGSYKDLELQIAKLEQQAKSMADAFGDGAPEVAKLNAVILEQKNKLKELDAAQGNFQRNVGNYPQFSAAFGILKKEFDEVGAKLSALKSSQNADSVSVKNLSKEYELLGRIVNSQEAGFVNMAQEIKSNQRAIEQLTAAYGEDNEIVKQLIQTNAELRDSQGDLIATQKTLGSDTFVFDGLIQSAQGLASVYGVAEGAAALFGEENEELQKQMVKLQAVMTVITSLQGIMNTVQKEGAAVQLFSTIREKALTAVLIAKNFVLTGSTTATAANTAATVAQGTATTGTTVATRAATVAMIGFRGALLASGIGVIVLLLANAVSGWNFFSESVKEATERQREFNDAAKNTRGIIDDFATGLNDIRTEGLLARLKATGASISQIFLAERDGLDKNFALQKKAYENQIKYIDAEIEALEEEDKAKGKLSKEDQKRLDSLRDERFKLGVDSTLFEEKYYESRKTLEVQFSADLKKEAEARAKARKEAADREAKDQYERAKQLDEALDALRKYRLEQDIKIQEEIFNDEKLSLDERNVAYYRAAQDRIKIAEIERDTALRNENLTFNERTLILEKFRDRVQEINKDLQLKITVEFDREGAERELDLINKRRQVYLEKGLAEGMYSEEKYSDQLYTIEEDRLKRRIEILKKGQATEAEILDAEYEYYKLINQRKSEEDRKVAELKQELQSALSGVSDVLFEREQAQREQALEETQEARARELELAGDNVKQRDIINKEYDKKERKIKRDMAIADREKALFDIAINTAVAVSKASPAIPLMAFAAAIGLVQAALVYAKPIPKYAKGTEYAQEGFAIVDEQGPELHISGGKTYLGSNKGPRLTYLKTGDKIKTASETKKILDEGFVNNTINSFEEGNRKLSDIVITPSVDVEKLIPYLNNIAEVTKNKPVPHISLRRGELKYTAFINHNEVEYLNGKGISL